MDKTIVLETQLHSGVQYTFCLGLQTCYSQKHWTLGLPSSTGFEAALPDESHCTAASVFQHLFQVFHTRGASERTLQPVVNAAGVVGVHAGQQAYVIAHGEVQHTNDAPWRQQNSVDKHKCRVISLLGSWLGTCWILVTVGGEGRGMVKPGSISTCACFSKFVQSLLQHRHMFRPSLSSVQCMVWM